MSNGYSNPFTDMISQCITTFLVATLWLLAGCHPLPWSPAFGSVGLFLSPAPMMPRFDYPVYIYSPPGLKPELNIPLLPGFPYPGGCSLAATLKSFSATPRAPARHFAMHLSEFIRLRHNHLHGPTLRSFEFRHRFGTTPQMDRIRMNFNMERYA